MIVLQEPIPIPPDTPNAAFFYNQQLAMLFQGLRNLSFTQRDGAIQHNDKAGNLDAKWVVFTSNGTANTEDAITHALGRVPVMILAAVPDKAARLYDSGTTWTSTTIYLKTNVATVAWKAIIL